jgi:hypothetical protein
MVPSGTSITLLASDLWWLFFYGIHSSPFQDLLDDWSSKSIPDLLYFVPYTWKFRFLMKKFEVTVPTNEYNWVDTSSAHQENSHLGLCGDLLDITFDLPFTEFLPQTVPFNFDFKVNQRIQNAILPL